MRLVLTLNGPIPDKVKKIKLNFYFNTAFGSLRVKYGKVVNMAKFSQCERYTALHSVLS